MCVYVCVPNAHLSVLAAWPPDGTLGAGLRTYGIPSRRRTKKVTRCVCPSPPPTALTSLQQAHLQTYKPNTHTEGINAGGGGLNRNRVGLSSSRSRSTHQRFFFFGWLVGLVGSSSPDRNRTAAPNDPCSQHARTHTTRPTQSW